MKAGLLGIKVGMTRFFAADGAAVPVTVVNVAGNRVAQVKTVETDGYRAAQVAFGDLPASKLNAPLRGHLGKHNAGGARRLREFRLRDDENPEPGADLSAAMFAAGEKVDVTGVTKGKGFAGVIKKHHFRSNRASHGNSRAHRKPGSTGQCQDPGRTFPGKKMPGRLGNKRRTAQNLEVARIDAERNLILIRGAIPGMPGGYVTVRPAAKRRGPRGGNGNGVNGTTGVGGSGKGGES